MLLKMFRLEFFENRLERSLNRPFHDTPPASIRT